MLRCPGIPLSLSGEAGLSATFLSALRVTDDRLFEVQGETIMFDNLFKCPDTIEAYSSAPLADERLSFLHHLRESGSGQPPCGIMRAASFAWFGSWN